MLLKARVRMAEGRPVGPRRSPGQTAVVWRYRVGMAGGRLLYGGTGWGWQAEGCSMAVQCKDSRVRG